jgi:phospholipid/cholesterol/gamma-HCH transport system substrate-binding protein
MNRNRVALKVSAFTIAMILVATGLVVVFGQFRFGSGNTYHASFVTGSRLKAGQKVRIAGVPVGTVQDVSLTPDYAVEVTFDVDRRYTLYNASRAMIRYDNLVGDRFLEIAPNPTGTAELRKLVPGAHIDRQHTDPALDLDALLGGLRPVLKGLDATKVNQISGAVIELLQGQGGALSDLLSDTGSVTSDLAARDHLIGDVINDLKAVLATVDQKSAQFSASIDQLHQLISGLSHARDPLADAIPPLASAETDLTSMLESSRRPLQGVLENLRPLATTLDDNKSKLNAVIDPLPENYLRLNALGAYGAFFNIFFCYANLKVNGPAGSDILIPVAAPPDPSKGRCSVAK